MQCWAGLRKPGLGEAGCAGLGVLVKAGLHRARLRGSGLRRAGLRRTELRRAGLRGIKLRGAWLRGAGLHREGLRGAGLSSPVRPSKGQAIRASDSSQSKLH